MTLIATISGSTSDTYATLAEFQTEAAALGWSLTATDADQETYLRRAAQYLDRNFQFIGFRATSGQALAWPRIADRLDPDGYAIPSDEIPTQVKKAQMEMAWLIHEGATPFATVESGAIRREKVKGGPVEVETEYSGGGRETPRYIAIEGILRGFTLGGGATVRMQRA